MNDGDEYTRQFISPPLLHKPQLDDPVHVNNSDNCAVEDWFITAVTEFRQPLQVQSHLEMPGILVQLGHTQRT